MVWLGRGRTRNQRRAVACPQDPGAGRGFSEQGSIWLFEEMKEGPRMQNLRSRGAAAGWDLGSEKFAFAT